LKLLITGAAGFVGMELVNYFLNKGHEIVALDKVEGDLGRISHPRLRVVIGGVEEYEIVKRACSGVDAVIHSAWSFATHAGEAFKVDVAGYANVLEAAVESNVKHFLFPDSTIAYGRPVKIPITEDHPLLPEESRAPIYALARVVTLKLNEIFYRHRNLPYTIFRFWWGYSDERIPGRTLRNLIDKALKGEEIVVPKDVGGSVLYTGDLVQAFERAVLNEKAYGQVFNLASFYITWEELVKIVIELTGSRSPVRLVPEEEWRGEAFMTGRWLIDRTKIERVLEYTVDEDLSKQKFRESLKKTIEKRKEELGIHP